MADTKEKIVFIKETTVSSIISDIFTYGFTIGAFWFNYQFIGGNDALDALLFITFFTMSFSHIGNYKKLKELAEDKK
jgi:hypothetical protein